MTMLKRRRRLAASVAVVAALVVGALVGGATTAYAATSFDNRLTPLIGTTGLDIPQVTYGGKIGYHLYVENDGDSTTQFASIVVTAVTATFLDTDNAACVAGTNSNQVVCTPTGGSLGPGDVFEANLRFTAPLTGTQVSTTSAVTIAAQTVGGKKNKGTTLDTSDAVLTNLVANGTKEDTFLREDETASTGALSSTHRQKFGVDLPPTLFGDPFGIAVSIHDNLGAICTECLPFHTELRIPAASLLSTPGNPFYVDPPDDDPVFNPYNWTMSARYESSFKLDGITHLDDGNNLNDVPACASIGGAPTFLEPFCWDTFVTGLNVPGPGGLKQFNASGRALENGKLGGF